MPESTSTYEAKRRRAGLAARVLLAQGLVVGAAVALCLYLTTGVNPRSVGFAAFACAAAALLACLRRADG